MWQEITKNFHILIESRSKQEIIRNWKNFNFWVQKSRKNPPYHLDKILKLLESRKEKKHHIRILDHGCGSGLTCFYLSSLGYNNILGVDVNKDRKTDQLNKIYKTIYKKKVDHFLIYNGGNLPFKKDSFDIIYSLQVLEHVSSRWINKYYSEEARIIKSNGVVYHQVPHILTPFETHTKTWLIHYLPKKIKENIYKKLGQPVEKLKKHLFLRSPFFHKNQLKKYFNNYEDLTLQRLRAKVNFTYYDGHLLSLRKMLHILVTLPILGKLLGFIIANLVMLETKSSK